MSETMPSAAGTPGENAAATTDESEPVLRRVAGSPYTAIIAIGIVLAVINFWWTYRYRTPGGLEVDETGYLRVALRLDAASSEGPGSLLRNAFTATTGPTVPLFAVPFTKVFGRTIWAAMLAQSALHIVAAVAVTGITRAVADRRTALVAGIVALTIPEVLMLDRSFQLATGAGAFLCLAVWALVSSDRGERLWPMLGFGLATAGMLTSRTMAVGFVPALMIAALVNTRWTRRALLGLAGAAIACLLTAGVWWIRGWDQIMGYLQRSGYSDFAGYWGSTKFWGRVGNRAGHFMLTVRGPYALGIIAVLALFVVSRIIWWRSDTTVIHSALADRRILVLWIVVLGGYAALLTTPNTGTWFDVPLILVMVAAVCSVAHGALTDIRAVGWIRAGSALGWSLVALVMVVALATTAASLPGPAGRDGERAGSLRLALYADTDFMLTENFDADARLESRDNQTRREAAREWQHVNERVVETVARYYDADDTLITSVTGSAHLMSINTLLLAGENTSLPVGSIELPVTFDPEQNLRHWLEPDAGGAPRIIVRIRGLSLRFPDDRFPERYDELVDELGWIVAEQQDLPDGGRVEILVHPNSDPLDG